MPLYHVEVQHSNDFIKNGAWFVLETVSDPEVACRELDYFKGYRKRKNGTRYQSGMGYAGRPLRIRCQL